jgi:hypothetical protein
MEKTRVATIHNEIEAALKIIAEKHNLSIAKTHITYHATGFKFAGEFGDKSAIGEVNVLYFKDLQRYGHYHNLTAADINKKFTKGDREYEFQGMKGRDWAICKWDDKMWKVRPSEVTQLLALKKN